MKKQQGFKNLSQQEREDFRRGPDIYLFWIGLALIAALTILFLVQAYLVRVEHQLALKSEERIEKIRRGKK